MSDNTRTVLVTGGTKGIGLAIALEFAKVGDQCIITYGWGSVEEDSIRKLFATHNCLPPYLVQADIINAEDTKQLMNEIGKRFGKVDIFISNVSFANLIKTFDDYSEKALLKSIEYSTWPIVAYTKQMYDCLGQYPRYVIGLSSHGPDRFHKNYDFAAITKTLLETMVKYLNYHFFNQDTIFNIVRTRPIITDSLLSTLGQEWKEFIKKFDISGTDVLLEEIGRTIVMLCSGLMDGIRGQPIIADKGYDFAEGLQHIYCEQYPSVE